MQPSRIIRLGDYRDHFLRLPTTLLLAGMGADAACLYSDATNAAVNRLEILEIVFGVLSLLGCLAVIAVIYGYNRDRRSLRDRILLGMFISNVIFSIGFLLPANMVHTSGPRCGLNISSAGTIVAGLGLMFGGKYMMVSYELFVVAASVHALHTGTSSIPRWVEITAHMLCVTTGIAIFAVFVHLWLPTVEVVLDYEAESLREQNAHGNTTVPIPTNLDTDLRKQKLVYKGELQGWLVFLGLVFVAWVYQRVVLWRLKVDWDANLVKATMEMNRDLWDTSDPQTVELRDRRRKLLGTYRDGFIEIAKPLEPYILVFLLFAPPAIIIATPQCEDDWGHVVWPDCQFKTTVVLSLRPLTTVAVFFYSKENRTDLRDVNLLGRKVWRRLMGFGLWCVGLATGQADLAAAGAGYKRAHFRVGLHEVREFERDAALDANTEHNTGDGFSYGLMEDP